MTTRIDFLLPTGGPATYLIYVEVDLHGHYDNIEPRPYSPDYNDFQKLKFDLFMCLKSNFDFKNVNGTRIAFFFNKSDGSPTSQEDLNSAAQSFINERLIRPESPRFP